MRKPLLGLCGVVTTVALAMTVAPASGDPGGNAGGPAHAAATGAEPAAADVAAARAADDAATDAAAAAARAANDVPANDVTAGDVTAQAELTGDITFSVPSGTFQGELSVSLSTSIANAQIRYTTDGRLPQASSTAYAGTPVRLTRTTQLRAQAFVGGAASGAPGTAVYVARAINPSHDLPVLVLDDYGQGAPGRDYVDVAVLEYQPTGGSVSFAGAPRIATRAGFHLRGNSSASFPKVPYRLELWDNDDDDADYPLLGLPEDSDWVLRGPYPDKALIRDAFALSLARDLGLYAPRFAFAEVYVNLDAQPLAAADYQGVYLIMENVKNSSNRLDLKQLKEADTTLPKITGGYIFKFEWMAAEEPILLCPGAPPLPGPVPPWPPTTPGPTSNCWNYLEVVDPDPINSQQRAWLTDHLKQFNDALNGPNFADPQTGYNAYIDVDSWINMLILNELSREMDAYVRSAHFYKDRDTKIFAGPPWDFDLTFGVGGSFNNDQTSGWQYQQTRTPQTNTWFPRLMQDPAFVNRVKVRWQSLRRGLLSNAQLETRINGLATPLTNAAQRNFQKWPILSTRQVSYFITPTNPTWQGQVQYMRDWMFQRATWLDSTAAWGGSTNPTPPGSTPPATTRPPTTTPPVTPTTPPGNPGRSCTAAYSVTSEWPGGFQGSVRITAGSSAISGWRVTWTFANGQTVTSSWNATITSSGSSVTASNAPQNGSLAAGTSTDFGFLGSWNGTNSTPSLTCTAS